MKRLLLITFFWIAATQSVIAQEPIARIELQEKDSILIGQQLHLTVDFLAPGFFTSAPQFPDLGMPHAIVTLPQQRAQNLVQTINDEQYSGIRQTYLIVPETSGDFSTPAKTIEIVYSTGDGSTKAQVTLPSIKFSVAAREGAETELVAKQLKIKQRWSEQPDHLKAGDSVTRTITVTADSTQSMLMPAISVPQIPGFRSYPKPPQLKDDNAGQNTTATRTETIVYVAEKSGHYTLPPIDYPWFDSDANKPVIAHLDPVQVSVNGTVTTATKANSPSPSGRSSLLSNSVLLAIALGLIGTVIFGLLAWKLWRSWNLRHRQSERYFFKQLIQTTKRQSLPQIDRALRVWLPKSGYSSFTEWRKQINSTELADVVDALQQLTYYPETTGPAFDRDRFRSLLSKYRSSRSTMVLKSKQSHLPQLNPF